MFAFAVWDERRRRLLLARDRVGKKPLFYAEGDGWLSFASELPRADGRPGRSRRRSTRRRSTATSPTATSPRPGRSGATSASCGPPTRSSGRTARSTTERYWRARLLAEAHARTARELEEELRERLGAAVRRRMISDVPLGAFLSGGVDSSIVVSEMAAASTQPVKTYSIGFEEEEYNELPRARVIAERFATDHHEFVVKPDAIELVPKLVRHYGEPYADSSAIPTFYLAELTRRHVTVALNGDGGDESFAGYLRHVANSLTGHLDSVPRPLRRGVAALGRALPEAARVEEPASAAPSGCWSPSTPTRSSATAATSRSSTTPSAPSCSIPDFRASLDPSRAPAVIADALAGGVGLEHARPAARGGRQHLPARGPAGEGGHRHHGLLARGALAVPRPGGDGVRRLAPAAREGEPRAQEAAPAPRLPRTGSRLDPRRRQAGLRRSRSAPGSAATSRATRASCSSTAPPSTAATSTSQPCASILDAHAAGQGDRSLQLWTLVMLESWHRERRAASLSTALLSDGPGGR